MIVIIDYGMGNLGSVANMLKKNGAESRISSLPEDIEKADKIILPGVGAFDTGMKQLNELNLISVLNKKVLEERIPVLGICLGMQLLAQESQEGVSRGLGWLKAKVVKFKFSENAQNLKIPHMGWNFVKICKESRLISDFVPESRFYFVHSYHIVCDRDDVLMETEYGYRFASAVQKDNIYGVQFHPEKSHRFGMQLFKNFCELN